MKKGLVALFLGMILILGACGNDDEDTSGTDESVDENVDESTDEGADEGTDEDEDAGESVASGEDVFQNNCASCHGADLSGNGGPSLVEVGSKYSEDELADIVQNGTGGMPPQSQVEGEDLDALTSWLSEQ